MAIEKSNQVINSIIIGEKEAELLLLLPSQSETWNERSGDNLEPEKIFKWDGGGTCDGKEMLTVIIVCTDPEEQNRKKKTELIYSS